MGRQIKKGAFFANGTMDVIVEGDVAEKVHFEGKVILDNPADEFADIRIILLAVLIHEQAELHGVQRRFQHLALFRIQFPDDMEQEIRVGHGSLAVSFRCLLRQPSEILNPYFALFCKISGVFSVLNFRGRPEHYG